MPKDNLTKLKKLYEVMQNDTLTPTQAKKFLDYCLAFISETKKSFDTLSAEKLAVMEEAIQYFEACKDDVCKKMNDMESAENKTLNSHEKRITNIESAQRGLNFEKQFNELKQYTDQLVSTIQNEQPKSISPADKKIIVDEIVQKLSNLDDEDIAAIVDGINGLDLSDDTKKIDWAHIKNAPEYGRGGRIVTGGNRYLDKLANVDTSGKQDGDSIVWDETTQKWIIGNGAGGSYTPQGPTTFGAGGIAAGTDLGTTPMSLQTILDMILYAYVAASITLATSPSNALREFGDDITSLDLGATTIKHSNPITAVTFFRNGGLIHTQASPLAGGGLETYTESNPVTSNTSFTAKVYDGTTLVTSNTVTFNFVYPFYYGVGATGLSGASIAALTKLIQTQQNTITITSPTAQVFYFAYPDSYPALTSILDTNGFETISDYTLRTVSITGLDGTPQTYKVYEYNNVTTQTGFRNTYKF